MSHQEKRARRWNRKQKRRLRAHIDMGMVDMREKQKVRRARRERLGLSP